MLTCTRQRVSQSLHAFENQPNSILRAAFVKCVPRTKQQSRTVRTKTGTDFYTNALRQDERLLKRLEAQLEKAKARQKREEEEAEEFDKMHSVYGTGNTPQNHNKYFWQEVLSQDDRARLLNARIRDFDEMYALQAEAVAATRKPPYPSIEDLEPRLRLAHETYISIPSKIAAKRISRFSSGFF